MMLRAEPRRGHEKLDIMSHIQQDTHGATHKELALRATSSGTYTERHGRVCDPRRRCRGRRLHCVRHLGPCLADGLWSDVCVHAPDFNKRHLPHSPQHIGHGCASTSLPWSTQAPPPSWAPLVAADVHGAAGASDAAGRSWRQRRLQQCASTAAAAARNPRLCPLRLPAWPLMSEWCQACAEYAHFELKQEVCGSGGDSSCCSCPICAKLKGESKPNAAAALSTLVYDEQSRMSCNRHQVVGSSAGVTHVSTVIVVLSRTYTCERKQARVS